MMIKPKSSLAILPSSKVENLSTNYKTYETINTDEDEDLTFAQRQYIEKIES